MFTLKFWYQMKAHFMLHDMSEIIFFFEFEITELSGNKQDWFGKVIPQ